MQINAQIQTCNFESLGLKLFDENIAKNYIQYVLSRMCIIKQEQQSKIGDSYKTNLKKTDCFIWDEIYCNGTFGSCT